MDLIVCWMLHKSPSRLLKSWVLLLNLLNNSHHTIGIKLNLKRHYEVIILIRVRFVKNRLHFKISCLESYERHVQMKCCPLCRDTTYQKMLTAEGRRACRRISAIKIQKTWRMWKCRKAYLEYQQHHPPKHPKLLKTYHLNKLKTYNDLLEMSMQSSTKQLDHFLKEMDIQVAASKRIINSSTETMQHMQKIQLSTLDWDQVYIKACQLETDCCAICIMPLNPTKTSDTASKQIPKKRHRLGLLSCAHMFHWVCLERLERFDIDRKVHVCPVCRRHYEKLEIQMDSKQETLI
ncbi:hypothetical protein O5D80_007483 [Batrachochytrium dendrobatidis]|nr:hypothetical protein O5D80_007483 [Batrachochytrium dendrobatidis]